MSEKRKKRINPPLSSGASESTDEDLFARFVIKFRGMLAEADLRGMSPLAVFFDWLDELHVDEPERAAKLLASMPADTRVAYREWRNGRGKA